MNEVVNQGDIIDAQDPPQASFRTAQDTATAGQLKPPLPAPSRRAFANPKGRPVNRDSLNRVCLDGRLTYEKARKMLSPGPTTPMMLTYRHRTTTYVRNRPQFYAWYHGFGLGPEAVDAWRKWEYEKGNKELALEPEPEQEPGAAPRHMTSQAIAADHADYVAGVSSLIKKMRADEIKFGPEGRP